MKKLLIVLIILLSTPVLADINPQTVDKMTVGVTEVGSIEVSGSVSNVQLNLTIPQEDMYQRIDNFVVSDSNGACGGSCSYDFVYDKFGNKFLNINWQKPSSNIDFLVNLTVSVNRRYSVDKKTFPEFLQPTSLVQSTDSEIADLASKARGTDFEKVAYLSKWINENVRYNTVYSDVNIPATEILQLKMGVCKEFSNLLVSFMRNLGYYSAVDVGYVYPGRVYGGETFQPHGWAEIYSGNGTISDPTWGEVGYLDATHIKFATLPDSSWTFSSAYSTGFGDFKVNLKSTNVSVKILSYDEQPLVSFNSTFIEDNVWKGYAVLKTDLSAEGCLLTKLDVRSCSSGQGVSFLEKINEDNVTYFCNNKTVFTIFKIPELKDTMQYNCPISILVYGSDQQNIPLSLSNAPEGFTKLTVDKDTVSPKEKISASSPASYIFTDNGDYGFENLEFTAPYYDFNVYSYNDGALDQQRISVVQSKPLDASLEVNGTAYVGSPIPVSVVVRNLLQSPQLVTVTLGEQTQQKEVESSTIFAFNFTPQNEEDNLIQAVVSAGDFSTSLSSQITVIKETGPLDSTISAASGLLQSISDFFRWLLSLFGL